MNGYFSVLHNDCRSHFLHFQGLLGCNNIYRDTWKSNWFVVVSGRFGGPKIRRVFVSTCGVENILDLVKLKSWSWLRARLHCGRVGDF
ncbi:hypothetical protein QL285_094967 [Trifolium repens]|nr:hypothetical protein QL285_094967 [Trifolium repens]